MTSSSCSHNNCNDSLSRPIIFGLHSVPLLSAFPCLSGRKRLDSDVWKPYCKPRRSAQQGGKIDQDIRSYWSLQIQIPQESTTQLLWGFVCWEIFEKLVNSDLDISNASIKGKQRTHVRTIYTPVLLRSRSSTVSNVEDRVWVDLQVSHMVAVSWLHCLQPGTVSRTIRLWIFFLPTQAYLLKSEICYYENWNIAEPSAVSRNVLWKLHA